MYGRMAEHPDAEPEMTKTTLRIPKDLHRKLKIRAVEQDREMSELAAEAIEQYLEGSSRA